MTSKDAIAVMSALAQPVRLEAVMALAHAGAAGMNVNDLAAATGALQNTMSAHMAILARADLVEATKKGRETIYRLNRATIIEAGGFLTKLAVAD